MLVMIGPYTTLFLSRLFHSQSINYNYHILSNQYKTDIISFSEYYLTCRQSLSILSRLGVEVGKLTLRSQWTHLESHRQSGIILGFEPVLQLGKLINFPQHHPTIVKYGFEHIIFPLKNIPRIYYIQCKLQTSSTGL